MRTDTPRPWRPLHRPPLALHAGPFSACTACAFTTSTRRTWTRSLRTPHGKRCDRRQCGWGVAKCTQSAWQCHPPTHTCMVGGTWTCARPIASNHHACIHATLPPAGRTAQPCGQAPHNCSTRATRAHTCANAHLGAPSNRVRTLDSNDVCWPACATASTNAMLVLSRGRGLRSADWPSWRTRCPRAGCNFPRPPRALPVGLRQQVPPQSGPCQ